MKNNIAKTIALLFAMQIIAKQSSAQDIHFSQFTAIGNFMNPAFTGARGNDYQIGLQYRNQWKTIGKPFTTAMLYGDYNKYWKRFNISPGIKFYNDVAAQNLKTNALYLPIAGQTRINDFTVNVGIEAGYLFKSIDYSKQTFPNQFNWDKGSFDNNLQNIENLQNSYSVFDLNLGIAAKRSYRKIIYGAGTSVFHLTQPKKSFSNADSYLKRRYSLQLFCSATIGMKTKLDVTCLMMSQNKANENLLTAIINYSISQSTILFGGINNRYAFKNNYDAISVLAGWAERKFKLGLSYDVTTSSLNKSNDGRGAFEFFIIYSGINTKPKKIKMECERL